MSRPDSDRPSPKHTRFKPAFAVALLTSAMTLSASVAEAEITVDDAGTFAVYGDFRLRLESDRDSQRADGRERDDRTRARVRGRLGFKYRPSAWVELGARARTGSQDSQQSPHITFADFDDNDEGDAQVMLDKYYVKLEHERVTVTLGRDSLPLWKQNELYWDDDVTPVGIGVVAQINDGLQLRGGFHLLPDGGIDFEGQMATGQLVYQTKTESVAWNLAAGAMVIRGDDGPSRLRNGNSARDYTIWTFSGQSRFEYRGLPVALGADFLVNSEDYAADGADAFASANRDQTAGFVLSAKVGSTKPGNLLAGYYYAHIEALAVNASYAQDDWVRWGSATQTDASDLEGHELRFGYGLYKNMNLLARLYLVDAITSRQDGKRFRLDYNFKF